MLFLWWRWRYPKADAFGWIRLYVPRVSAFSEPTRDGPCGFEYLDKMTVIKKITPRKRCYFYGGDGGIRNRVRKLNLSLYTPVGRLISGQLRYAWRVTETLARSRSLLIDALSRSAVLPGKTAAIKQLLKQFYCCRLFLINLRFLKRYRTSARLPGFKIPVEILSSPCI